MTRTLAVALGFVLFAVARITANDVSVRPVNTWTADAGVVTATASNGVVYLGGFFQSFGPRIGPLVAIDKATNRALQWPQFTGGPVLHVLPDPDGGYVVHHEYQTTDGQRGHRLVRLTAAGEIDQAFQWGYTGTLNTVVLAGDRLVVSAYADGVPGYASAIVDRRSGRLVAGPLPLMVSGGGTGPDGALLVWAVAAGQSGLVRLNAASGAIERVVYTPPSGTITAMAMSGARAYVATSRGLTPSGEIVAVDLTTGTSTPIAAVAGWYLGRVTPPPVSTIVPHRGRLYLQGNNLHTVNGSDLPLDVSGLAAIDAVSGALTAWRRPAGTWGTLLTADDDRIIFVSTGGFGGPQSLFALEAETGAGVGWRLPLLAGAATAVVVEASRLIVGGSFGGVGVVARSGLAAITVPDGQPTAWHPASAEETFALAVSGTRVFAVHGYPSRLVEYDAVTGDRAAWTATASGEIKRMSVAGDRLFVVGSFTAIDGQVRNGVASFDLRTSPPALEAWTAPWAASDVAAVHVLPLAVLLGGSFTTGAGGPIHRLVALDPLTGAALPWFPVIDGPVLDLAVTADRLLVSGSFNTVNGESRPRLAMFETNGRLLPWRVDDARGIANEPRLALFEDRAYVTGSGDGHPSAIAFDLVSGQRTNWVPTGGGAGRALLAVPDRGLFHHRYIGAGGESAFAFYPRIPSIPPVTGLHGAVDGSQVYLAWDAAPGADSYEIEAGTGPGLANLAVIRTGSSSPTFTTAAPNGRYYVRVRGVNEGGRGPASDDLVIAVGEGSCAGPPGTPAAAQATTSGLNATLTWQPPSGGEAVTRYAVDLVSGPGSPALLARVTGTSLSGSGPAGTYAVTVRAENACGTSAATPPVTIVLAASAR